MAGFESELNKTGFIYDSFGVVSGTATLSQFPDVPCSIFRLKARSSNSGSFFIGNKYNTGSAVLPWELDAGDDSGWCVSTSEFGFNLNSYYQKGSSGTSDILMYWVQR